jgi:low temperature requirement protein LtrA
VKGIPLPERTEDFTADPVELFFDLAYVLAFSQLVGLLIDSPTWSGAGTVALLFALLWLPWQELTWSANAVSGNSPSVRVIFSWRRRQACRWRPRPPRRSARAGRCSP